MNEDCVHEKKIVQLTLELKKLRQFKADIKNIYDCHVDCEQYECSFEMSEIKDALDMLS